ncbi:MAG: hypothetical protein Q8936_14100 [Bacillota bacterium]|nr:hypothetical protein [Bacillota bacterium]
MASLAQCRQEFNQIRDSLSKSQSQHIQFNDKETIIYASDKNKIYVPSPTGKLFHESNSFINLVVGPYGSGKSTMCVNYIVRSVCDMPRWHNGRRRARWAIVRNTSGELYSTTLQTWLTWFGELGDIRKRQKPLLTYEHTFNDGQGVVELELIFIALDREEDLRKIKSLEVTGAYINELSEVPQGALSHFKGRVNHRYPSRSFCPDPYWSGIIADTNPPDIDHWIYKDFELKSLDSYRIFHQPAGLLKNEDGIWVPNVHCDNASNLANDYYVKLAEGQTEDFVKVYCLGEYGSVGFGKKVYPEFNPDLHAVLSLGALQGEPLYLGIDFGLTPACVVCQLTPRGQLLVLKEYIGIDIGIRSFIEMVVIPGLQKDFPYCTKWIGYADPAGNNRSEIVDEMSCIGEINQLGIKCHAARTNDIEPRLASVRFFLNRMVDGKPAFQMDRTKCPTLFRGFTKDYVYTRLAVSGEERYRDKPNKNMSSHPMDGLGYDCIELASDNIARDKTVKNNVDMNNPVFRWQN